MGSVGGPVGTIGGGAGGGISGGAAGAIEGTIIGGIAGAAVGDWISNHWPSDTYPPEPGGMCMLSDADAAPSRDMEEDCKVVDVRPGAPTGMYIRVCGRVSIPNGRGGSFRKSMPRYGQAEGRWKTNWR